MAEITDLLNVIKQSSTTIIVVAHPNDPDELGAAGALAEQIIANGASATLASMAQVPTFLSAIPRAKTVQHKLGNQQLHISFPYQPTQVDKVSYHIDDEQGRFVLVIQPQTGQQPLDSTQVNFDYAGLDVQTVIMFGVDREDQVLPLLADNPQLLTTASTILFTKQAEPTMSANLVFNNLWSYAQIVVDLFMAGDWPLTEVTATGLLAGIDHASDNFQSPLVGAEVFELAANLMKAGGKRLGILTPKNYKQANFNSSNNSANNLPNKNRSGEFSVEYRKNDFQPAQLAQSTQQTQPAQPTEQSVSKDKSNSLNKSKKHNSRKNALNSQKN